MPTARDSRASATTLAGDWGLISMRAKADPLRDFAALALARGGVQNFVFLILLGIVELCFKVNHKLTHGLFPVLDRHSFIAG